MNKKQAALVIASAAVLALAANVFFGRYLSAKISTWPLLNKWQILNPQAPIVINNRETVRVNDSGDAAQAAQQLQPKLSTIVYVNGSAASVAGAALNLSSDGSFVTAAPVFGAKAPAGYFVVLGDGTQAAISQIAFDPATGLAFFRAPLAGVPVQALGSSGTAAVGDKIFLVENSLQDFTARAWPATVSQTQADIEGRVFNADQPSRGFEFAAQAPLQPGEVAADAAGNVLGIYNGSSLVSASVLKTAMNLYFNGNQRIIRPSFGFSYVIVTDNDSTLSGLPAGAQVKSVSPGSPAREAGLQAGDVITSIDGQAVNETNLAEPLLETYKPGDTATLVVTRGQNQLTVRLKVGELK